MREVEPLEQAQHKDSRVEVNSGQPSRAYSKTECRQVHTSVIDQIGIPEVSRVRKKSEAHLYTEVDCAATGHFDLYSAANLEFKAADDRGFDFFYRLEVDQVLTTGRKNRLGSRRSSRARRERLISGLLVPKKTRV